MYKAVLFDVGGVLISPPQEAIRKYSESIGVFPGTLSEVFIHGQPKNAFCRLERGELTLSQFVPEFDKECFHHCQVRNEDCPRGFSAGELFAFIASQSKPNFPMLAVVEMLRTLGYKTCALTNNWIDGKDGLQSILGSYFDLIIESCKVGIRKPNHAIYQLACEKLEVQPSEVVFLDDLGMNLKSASKLGMTTIKVQSTNSAIKRLEQTLLIDLVPTAKL